MAKKHKKEPIYYFLWEVDKPHPVLVDYNPKASYNYNTYANDYSFLSLINSTFKSMVSDDKNLVLNRLISVFVNSQNEFLGFGTLYERYEQWINHTRKLTDEIPEYTFINNWCKSFDIVNAITKMRVDGFEVIEFSESEMDNIVEKLGYQDKNKIVIEYDNPITFIQPPAYSDLLSITPKHEKFLSELTPYKFTELEKVKCLNSNQQRRLIDTIVEYDTPSAIAMLHFIEFPKKLKTEYGCNKEKQYSIIAKSLGVSKRTVKGNFLTVSNPNSTEDQYKYPACDKLPNCIAAYDKICNNT